MTKEQRIQQLQDQKKELTDLLIGLEATIVRAKAAIKTTTAQLRFVGNELDGLIEDKIKDVTETGDAPYRSFGTCTAPPTPHL